MKKRHILKMLSLLAAVCITAGCNGSTTAETTTTTVAQTTTMATTKKTLEKTITSADNSEQPLFQKEFEIIDWTMDEFVSNMTLCKNNFTIPCSIKDLEKDFVVNQVDGYQHCDIFLQEKDLGTLYIDDEKSTDVVFNSIVIGGLYGEDLPEFDILGITNYSDREEIINILGEPNVITDEPDRQLRYYFSNDSHVLILLDAKAQNIIYLGIYNKGELQ